MRVLYIHQHYSTPSGTTGTRSYELAKSLCEAGHSVTMVCGTHDQSRTPAKEPTRHSFSELFEVKKYSIPYSNKFGMIGRSVSFLVFAARASLFSLFYDYDVIFCTSTPLTAAIPGIISKLFRKKVFIFEVRDLWPRLPVEMGAISNEVLISALYKLEGAAYRCADSMIGVAPGITQHLREQTESQKPVALIPNACDIEFFGDAKFDYQLSDEMSRFSRFVIYAGSHGRANGLMALLEAAEVLQDQKVTEVCVVLCGDGETKSDLQNYRDQRQLNNVVMLDPIPKTHLAGFYKKYSPVGCQILSDISGFYDGTSPNKFFDYLAAGLPVLVNYPGWISELVKEYDCGLVSEPGNAEQLASHIAKLSLDSDELIRLSNNAKRLARSRFDRSVLNQSFVDFFESTDSLEN